MSEEEYKKLWHDRIDEWVKSVFGIAMVNGAEYISNLIEWRLTVINLEGTLADKLKAKFDKGMAEHGMNFDKVDFDKEIEDEIVDLCNYFIGKHYSKKEK